MPISMFSLALVVLAGAPATDATAQEQHVRSILLPSAGGSAEVFVPVFSESNPYGTTAAVVLPAPVSKVEAAPEAVVMPSEGGGELANRLYVAARHAVSTGPGLEVHLTLVDESQLKLRLVTRPNIVDGVLTLRRRPLVSPEESARLARERLLRCESLGEAVSGKTRLIAERGSEAVINRAVGDGHSFKQTNRISITFVDVVHDVGISYATLVVKNRSDVDWPIDLARIKLSSLELGEVQIISRASEFASIPPGEQSRIVLAYETPALVSALVVSVSETGQDLPSLLVRVIP